MTPEPCPPEHGPVHARQMCYRCYWGWYFDLRDSGRPIPPLPPHRGQRTVALVERAERIRAELAAAEDYTGRRATWALVAERLGVAPKTLDRARLRARQYRAREEARA